MPAEAWISLASVALLAFGGVLGWAVKSARKDAEVDHLQTRVTELAQSTASAADSASMAARQVVDVSGKIAGVMQRLEHMREDVHVALQNIGQRDIEVRRKVNRIRERAHDLDKRVHVLERLGGRGGGNGGVPERVGTDRSTPLDI